MASWDCARRNLNDRFFAFFQPLRRCLSLPPPLPPALPIASPPPPTDRCLVRLSSLSSSSLSPLSAGEEYSPIKIDACTEQNRNLAALKQH